MLSKPELKVSDDGSHTVMSDIFQVTYHSRHGAITESNVVFIDAGLNYLYQRGVSDIAVFEMGFGTGLNALLSAIWAETNQLPLSYHTIEAFPLPEKITEQLNYAQILGHADVFRDIHQAEWNKEIAVTPWFTLKKIQEDVEKFEHERNYDVIFYDAFAPASQPHLWGVEMLSRMYEILKTGGILVSYCAQGAFKRNLKACNFNVESIPGPPGKREMTRAVKH